MVGNPSSGFCFGGYSERGGPLWAWMQLGCKYSSMGFGGRQISLVATLGFRGLLGDTRRWVWAVNVITRQELQGIIVIVGPQVEHVATHSLLV